MNPNDYKIKWKVDFHWDKEIVSWRWVAKGEGWQDDINWAGTGVFDVDSGDKILVTKQDAVEDAEHILKMIAIDKRLALREEQSKAPFKREFVL